MTVLSPNMGECFQIIPRPNIDKYCNIYCKQFGAQRQIVDIILSPFCTSNVNPPLPLAERSYPFCYNRYGAADVNLLTIWYSTEVRLASLAWPWFKSAFAAAIHANASLGVYGFMPNMREA
jgi:hypothetical protein